MTEGAVTKDLVEILQQQNLHNHVNILKTIQSNQAGWRKRCVDAAFHLNDDAKEGGKPKFRRR